ncbi:MAG TPA: redoxin domain-containing protein [Acidimicrobiia bacterium]|nr:redoxin domain-containing protein [Acidimicrobiia bacterium]
MTDVDRTGAGARPGRLKYAVLALALVVAAAAGVVVASSSDPSSVSAPVDTENLPVGPPPPSMALAKGWINSEPLTTADLRDKVVVYDIWTYSCINCIRTFPYLRAWYERYADDGLVIIGVHSPEFEFEKVHSNVEDAVDRNAIEYPVALDDDMDIWNAFGNRYWPAKYIADRKGRVRYLHFGEGGYEESEAVIRTLLGVRAGEPFAAVDDASPDRPQLDRPVTAETYLGVPRGSTGAPLGASTSPEPGDLAAGDARLVGAWTSGNEEVESDEAGAAIVMRYQAGEVNLVMAAPDGTPIDVTVELDGEPLPPGFRTPQTMVDESGATFVRVTVSDLYRLVLAPEIGDHTLRLTARAPGLQAFAFTFGA